MSVRKRWHSPCERTITNDLNVLAEVASLVIDLDAVMEVLLERGAIEDAIRRWLRVVHYELMLGRSRLSGGCLGGLDSFEQRHARQPGQTERRNAPVSLLRR